MVCLSCVSMLTAENRNKFTPDSARAAATLAHAAKRKNAKRKAAAIQRFSTSNERTLDKLSTVSDSVRTSLSDVIESHCADLNIPKPTTYKDFVSLAGIAKTVFGWGNEGRSIQHLHLHSASQLEPQQVTEVSAQSEPETKPAG